MIRWEIIANGVRKYSNWGWVDIYMPIEDCFTKIELMEITTELHSRKNMQALGPGAAQLYAKLQKKLKGIV